MNGPVLTYHSFCEPVGEALARAAWHEKVRYGGDQYASAVLVARARRYVRADLPYASDGLLVRIVRHLQQTCDGAP